MQLKKGDILVEKSGGSPYQPVGRVMFIDDLPFDKPVLFSNFLQKIVVNEKVASPIYIYAYLRTLYHKNYMEYIQNQTTGIKNLLTEEFLEIPIILVDRAEQERIGQKYFGDLQEVKKRIAQAYEFLQTSRKEVGELMFQI